MKAGIKSTEFWLSLLTSVLSVFGALQGFIPVELSVKIIAVIVMVYTIARTIVKFSPNKTDDAVLEKIEAILKEKEIPINKE